MAQLLSTTKAKVLQFPEAVRDRLNKDCTGEVCMLTQGVDDKLSIHLLATNVILKTSKAKLCAVAGNKISFITASGHAYVFEALE